MKILVTGATGLVGRRLLEKLYLNGFDDVRILSRNKKRALASTNFPLEVFEWNPRDMAIDKGALKDVDVVIHLAGEGVADGRWSEKKKESILTSRVNSTKLLTSEIKKLDKAPSKFISAGAVGIYGNRADESLNENSDLAEGYLADVCKQWQELALNHGIEQMKSHSLRFGVVLSNKGGALPKMLPPFKMGVGGILGNGKQYMSWIHIDDLVGQLIHLVENEGSHSVYNSTAPNPVTNYEFTKTLGKQLKRPTIFPVPAPIIKGLFGEVSEIVLHSQRVYPENFLGDGYKFEFSDLKSALSDILDHDVKDEFVLNEYQWVNAPMDKVFDFFKKETNLEKITPKYLNFNVLRKSTENLEKGTIIDYKLSFRGLPMTWKTRINEFELNDHFIDEQIQGPYAKWLHTHRFIPVKNGILINDKVIYKLPLGKLGRLVAGWFVTRDVKGIFKHRVESIDKIFKA